MVEKPSADDARAGSSIEPRSTDTTTGAYRVHVHPVLGPAPERATVRFTFDGVELQGFDGEPVAAALLAHGIRTLRASRSGVPRGAYCFIGHCFECRVTIDGRSHERACLTPLRADMAVTRGDA